MLAMAVPKSTPNLAWLNKVALSLKERLAINNEIVNPIPPNRLIPVKLLHVIPLDKVESLHLMDNQVNR